MGEFDLIDRFFTQPAKALYTPAVHVGIGDDCAVLQPAPNAQLLVSSDMMVEGRHFFADTDPYRLGHKALATNLSDLAACGATPLGFTLALALPKVDESWLDPFSKGMLALAQHSACPLVGGDTTSGPLTISITVFGQIPQDQALLRSGAKVGHDIYVTGAIGEARAGLHLLEKRWECNNKPLRDHLIRRLEAPTPRLAIGHHLRGVASSAMDLSDGLRGDLGHLLKASQVGARINGNALLSTAPRLWMSAETSAWTETQKIAFAMAGGDDYELLFTAHPGFRAYLTELGQELGVGITRIGEVLASLDMKVVDTAGQICTLETASFDHFKSCSRA
ncbi:thiamine-phosphate kinase [Lampropedia puyangensis]|uniref:Thiamine-monophosphate kinase n=1 Tax=Lampropedia puyangensis TaxID=1330072 RepID=A0A4S8EZB7_9BURK|nr:thiamine-phosphate kinase [Lampropedia puyangensis]THU00293.1 thiamine-phosphate kinase [Lampropedia puyangensis]